MVRPRNLCHGELFIVHGPAPMLDNGKANAVHVKALAKLHKFRHLAKIALLHNQGNLKSLDKAVLPKTA